MSLFMFRMSFLYFSYGSNMLRERIHMNNPSAVFVAVAKLINYRLRFCVQSHWGNNLRWRGGAATIEESEGDFVWGVVWKLQESDLESLDDQEGVNQGVYHRLNSLEVTTATDKSILECVSYQLLEPVFIKPSPHYLKVLQMGAVQHGLPKDYRQFLNSIEHNGYDGPLPLFDEIMEKGKL